MILLASPTKTPQYCDADEMLLKATTTKTLNIFMEHGLGAFEAFGPFGGFRAEDARRFSGWHKDDILLWI